MHCYIPVNTYTWYILYIVFRCKSRSLACRIRLILNKRHCALTFIRGTLKISIESQRRSERRMECKTAKSNMRQCLVVTTFSLENNLTSSEFLSLTKISFTCRSTSFFDRNIFTEQCEVFLDDRTGSHGRLITNILLKRNWKHSCMVEAQRQDLLHPH